LMLDPELHEVRVQNKPVLLTTQEFRLLAFFVERRGQVQGRDTLQDNLWSRDRIIDSRTINTHLRRLRVKLGPAGSYLETIRGVGYRWIDSPPLRVAA
jgi:two-component system phosphate regulon response regulator PhoB